MEKEEIRDQIKSRIDNAPRNDYTVELHLQMLKYADDFSGMTGEEFCQFLDIKPAFKTEFTKMRKLRRRLKSFGLDLDLIE